MNYRMYWKEVSETEVQEITFEEYIQDMRNKNREERFHLITKVGPWRISTCWLFGINSCWVLSESPLLYETMVFCRLSSKFCEWDSERYSTREQAREGHKLMVEKWSKRGYLWFYWGQIKKLWSK